VIRDNLPNIIGKKPISKKLIVLLEYIVSIFEIGELKYMKRKLDDIVNNS